MTITRKLMLTYILIAILPTIFITLVSLHIMSNRFSEELIRKGNTSLVEAEAFINNYFEQGRKIAVFLAHSKEVKEHFFFNSIQDYLETFKDFIDIAVVEIFDHDKKLIKRIYRDRKINDAIFTDPSGIILDQTLDLEKISSFFHYKDGLCIKVSEPIIDDMTLDVIGAIIISFPFNDSMARHLKARVKADITILFLNSGRIISTILDETGRSINKIWKGGISDSSLLGNERITKNEKIASHYYTISYDLLFDDIEKPIAILSTAINRDSIEASKWNTYSVLLFCSGGVLFIVLIVGFFMARSITAPINKLLASIRTITRGNLGEEIETDRTDELGVLAKGFAHMRDAVRKQITDLSQLNLEIVSKNDKLKKYRLHLEELVKERTLDLHSANRNLMEQVKETSKAMQVAERANQAKSEFLANMSHEIRTPLNAVTGFSELLSSMTKDAKQQSYIAAIKIAGKSLLTLINDILDLSKIEAGMLEIRKEPVYIKRIFHELEQIFHEKINNKGLEFKINIDKGFPPCLILDETRIRQVLVNLVGNAVKFTEKGYISLTAKSRNSGNGKIDLVIFVEDTGMGIGKKDHDMIFEAFKQLDGSGTRKHSGTGLGLSISKRLVEAMNGQISITSRKNIGSLFEIILNDIKVGSADELLIVEDQYFDIENTVFEKNKVLVAENIESNRNLLMELLTKVNLEVMAVENGREALLAIKKCRPDLILMDIKMPVMDGVIAAKQLKSDPDTKKIPILALTAGLTPTERFDIREKGFDGYLVKPIDTNKLFNELSRYFKYVIKDKIQELINAPDTIDIDRIDRPDELIFVLENEILLSIQTMEQVMVMGQIEELGQRLHKLGEEHKIELLTGFSDDLLGYVNVYDVIGIKKKFQELPVFIKLLTNMLEDSGRLKKCRAEE